MSSSVPIRPPTCFAGGYGVPVMHAPSSTSCLGGGVGEQKPTGLRRGVHGLTSSASVLPVSVPESRRGGGGSGIGGVAFSGRQNHGVERQIRAELQHAEEQAIVAARRCDQDEAEVAELRRQLDNWRVAILGYQVDCAREREGVSKLESQVAELTTTLTEGHCDVVDGDFDSVARMSTKRFDVDGTAVAEEALCALEAANRIGQEEAAELARIEQCLEAEYADLKLELAHAKSQAEAGRR
eukprot:TRINITY_DN36582_c0_g1_i1.p1 TRINITY_DN36582_c0_g1~~TRINITY_DN36582_c0_g1_i1.p1  ORF type:complete len:240 (+),score=39.21 TRINITY_DN36582_c0_g1_i1:82-801(+)